MTVARILAAAVLLAAFSGDAAAQDWPPRPGQPAVDPHRYQVDQHRFDMHRLRAQADQREAFARQLALESRLNRLEIEAARQPEPVQPPAWGALRTPEEERAAREAAARRRASTTTGVNQIDAWLDRPRN